MGAGAGGIGVCAGTDGGAWIGAGREVACKDRDGELTRELERDPDLERGILFGYLCDFLRRRCDTIHHPHRGPSLP